MPKQTALSTLGGAKETTYGTPVAAAFWLPHRNPSIADDYTVLRDEGFRGSPAGPFGAYQGVVTSHVEFEGDFYAVDTPHLLMGILGSDSVTGAADPYTHTLKLTAAQPPSYTYTDEVADTVFRQYPGQMVYDLELRFTPEEGLTYAAKLMGLRSQTTSAPTPSYDAAPFYLGWQAAVSLGGSANAKLTGASVHLTREAAPVFGAQNLQSPSLIFLGPLRVSGSCSFYWDDDTELLRYLNNTQGAFVFTFDRGVTPARQLVLTMTQAAFEKGAVNRGKIFVETDVDFEAIANATDGSAAVLSPVQVVAKNGRSAAY